jgi:tRNA pseudouridine55 synthase
MNGLVLIDKPSGCTSHDVVNRWRRLAHTKSVGHLGTLDPMATGLLLLVTGNATRLARFFEKQTKTYEAEIQFGLTSNTYDVEGEVCPVDVPIPDASRVLAALDTFRGRFLQTPPPVSAKKIAGVPAYKLARRNQPVELAPVEVEVLALTMTNLHDDTLSITVTVSAGTYIRSLSHDLGTLLGCGAILTRLRRIACGDFRVEDARTLDELGILVREERLAEAIVPAAAMLPQFPTAYVDAQTETQIRQGRDFRTSPFSIKPGAPFVKAVSSSGELISIGELRLPNVYHPLMVL